MTSPRHADLILKIHRAQKLLLDTMYLIASLLPVEFPRPYLTSLPTNDRNELENQFSENILFAAQALSHGFRIRGIETSSFHLRIFAEKLAAALEAVRFVFRTSSVQMDHDLLTLTPVTQDFLHAWATFEHEICRAYFGLADADEWVKLLVRSIELGISRQYFGVTDVDGMEPFLMFGLPRLAMTLAPEWVSRQSWFKDNHLLLGEVTEGLALLSEPDLHQLQQWLLDNPFDENGVLLAPKERIYENNPQVEKLFRGIASLVDELQGGTHAKIFTCILSRAFTRYSDSVS